MNCKGRQRVLGLCVCVLVIFGAISYHFQKIKYFPLLSVSLPVDLFQGQAGLGAVPKAKLGLAFSKSLLLSFPLSLSLSLARARARPQATRTLSLVASQLPVSLSLSLSIIVLLLLLLLSSPCSCPPPSPPACPSILSLSVVCLRGKQLCVMCLASGYVCADVHVHVHVHISVHSR